MGGEFGDRLEGDSAAVGAEKNDGERGAVGDGLGVGEEFAAFLSLLQEGRSKPLRRGSAFADEDGVVAEFGGEVGEGEGGVDAVAGDAGDEYFCGGGGFRGDAEDFAGLVVGEECGLAGWAEDDEAGGGRLRVARYIGGELVQIESAIRMERSGQRDVEAFEEHGVSSQLSVIS